MIEVIRPFHPEVADSLKTDTHYAEAARMGTMAANIFYCSNYLAYQHEDNDASPGICSQLVLDRIHADEWNFSYTEWGRYIVNEPNTVWYVSHNLPYFSTLRQ
jgi:hypothetical protein